MYVLCFTRPKISGERLQDHWSSGSYIFVETISLWIDKLKSKKAASVSEALALLS